MSVFYSLEATSKNAITYEEIKNLDNERPLGISGHLRVKNEERTIKLCILSILPFLDELIITLQPSTDNTEKIILALKEQHEDKIKVYYYNEKVVPVPYSHISRHEVKDIVNRFNGRIHSKSVHSLAHYYNYGLVRISYKYYMKVDADQIYFTNKLMAIREGIFKAHEDVPQDEELIFISKESILTIIQNTKAALKRAIKKYLGNTFVWTCLKWCKKQKNDLLFFIATKIKIMQPLPYELVVQRVQEAFSKHKNIFYILQGLNLGMPACKKDEKPSLYPLENILKIFVPVTRDCDYICLNGEGDHFITSPKSCNIYLQRDDSDVEYFKVDNLSLIGGVGICWFHWGLEKRNRFIIGKEGVDFMSLQEFLNKETREVFPQMFAPDTAKNMARPYFMHDTKFIKEFLETKLY